MDINIKKNNNGKIIVEFSKRKKPNINYKRAPKLPQTQ